MTDQLSTERAMWTLVEPVHVVAYFAPEALAAFTEAGVRGYWRGYFAGRSAPLGDVGPAVVAASFYNFAPAFVARAIPGVWQMITREEAIRVREAGVTTALRGLLAGREADVAKAADLLWRAVAELNVEGRMLAAANAALPVSEDPVTRLWQATTLLREHRGDGHFAALVAAGIDGCEAVVLRCARDLSREVMQPARGWADEQWTAAHARLGERGWIGQGGAITADGRAALDAVEDATNLAASRPWARLGAAGVAEVADVLLPLAEICTASLPSGTPLGGLRPSRPAV